MLSLGLHAGRFSAQGLTSVSVVFLMVWYGVIWLTHSQLPSHHRYPKDYQQLIPNMKQRVEAVRQRHTVQQYSADPVHTTTTFPHGGRIKMGLTFNFIFIDGVRL